MIAALEAMCFLAYEEFYSCGHYLHELIAVTLGVRECTTNYPIPKNRIICERMFLKLSGRPLD